MPDRTALITVCFGVPASIIVAGAATLFMLIS